MTDYSGIQNHMVIGPADNYNENGEHWDEDRIPKWTEVEWEAIEKIEEDRDEREEYWLMTAELDGITYEGTGIYSCGELIEVQDIEIKK